METKILGAPRAETITGTNVKLLAPGFTGRFISVEPGAATRGRDQSEQVPLSKAASLTSVSVVLSGVIELDPPKSTTVAGVRGGPKGPPKVIVKALPKQDYAMLHTDEFGRKRWLFPEKNAASRTAAEAVFVVPAEAPSVEVVPKGAQKGKNASRGMVTKTMRRLVSVVTWVASPLIKTAAQKIAQAWEGDKRPYGLWQVAAGGRLVTPDWRSFDGGKSLLLIHGTFSTPAVGFGSWFESKDFAAVLEGYQGRVLALGHPSLSAAPEDNVDWLLDQLPGKAKWKGSFDVVCHSRGGLVARDLAARAALSKAPTIDRVCQVGTPNLGTLLADPKRWVDFLDTYTNCLTMLPDTTSTILLEGLLCLVKIVGTGAADGLPGLASMNPQGPWIKSIATRGSGSVRWYTIGANYNSASDVATGFLSRVAGEAADVAVDAFFKSENDMVVPSTGCHLPGVPPVDSLSLDDGKTTHTSYFENKKVRQALAKWLA